MLRRSIAKATCAAECALLVAIGLLAIAGTLAPASSAVTSAALPPDFKARFEAVCLKRGRPPARCACMVGVMLREIDDEHLALILDYFEDEGRIDQGKLAELEQDPVRMQELEEEIVQAITTAIEQCR